MLEALLKDLVDAIVLSIQDDPEKLGKWRIDDNYVSITTIFSRDPERSWNGGEYYYFRRFRITTKGVVAWDDWSADFQEYSTQKQLYLVGLSSLQRLVEIAFHRARKILGEA